MMKKIGLVIIAVLVIFVIFAMGMRRSHMMGGAGSELELTAVSADGAAIPLSPEVEALTGKLEKNTAAQKSGDMIVSLTLSPYPPSVGQPGTFDVKLTDINGKAIDEASISLDLTMPSMWMPPNQLTTEFVSGGKYSATGQFSMRGWWRIEVIITRGGTQASVFFDVGM